MNLRTDLHLHTTASDGRWTPEQLIDQVQRAGIEFFAITDHDSLGSLVRAAELVRDTGLRFLPGVEISSRLNGQTYHLLAFGFDAADPSLNAFVQANEERLAWANHEAVQLLIRAGHAISMDEYDTYTWDRSRGGWKALNFLIDRGLCRDVRSYFGELFGSNLAHPEADFPPPDEVIEVVHRAGGEVILAHPGVPFYNGLDDRRLDQLVEMGLDGLECFATHHDEAITQRFLEYSRRRRLLITGGSDSHGGFAGRSLGHPVVYSHDLTLGRLAEDVIGAEVNGVCGGAR
jgi:hypothetical protein